jgi:hypothetical protein
MAKDATFGTSRSLGALEGLAGLLGWWLGACLAVEGPASLVLTFISLHDASERKLLLPAAIGMIFMVAGLYLMRTSDKNDFKISWPAVHSHGSALRRAVLMRWLVWDWLPTTGVAVGVFAWLLVNRGNARAALVQTGTTDLGSIRSGGGDRSDVGDLKFADTEIATHPGRIDR